MDSPVRAVSFQFSRPWRQGANREAWTALTGSGRGSGFAAHGFALQRAVEHGFVEALCTREVARWNLEPVDRIGDHRRLRLRQAVNRAGILRGPC
ncbi:MAG: hypothetical protein HS128_21725 [Ideonella sp.]|nr:hypothetical protein [Ideonella sp.]